MKKDELIAKQKELIENLKNDLLFFAGKTYTTITIRCLEEEIEAAIEQEPLNELVKVPSDEEIEKAVLSFCQEITQEYYTTWVHEEPHIRIRIINIENAAKNITEWLKSQVKTINLRDELMNFVEYFEEQATKETDPNCSIDGDQYLLNWIPKAIDVDEYLNSKQ